MKQLCEAAEQKDGKSKQTVKLSSYAVMYQAVHLRLEEYTAFEKQKCFLLQLCQKIPSSVEGETLMLYVYH